MTPTGTNLLELVKHSTRSHLVYSCDVFGRPQDQALGWLSDAVPGSDMWAKADEASTDIVAAYRRSWQLADATVTELPGDAKGRVPWWGDDPVTLERVVVHLTAETQRHAGHADIVRELIDGTLRRRDGSGGPAAQVAYLPAHLHAVQLASKLRDQVPHVINRDRRGVRPSLQPMTPVLARRPGVSGSEVDMKVRHRIAVDEGVDVLGPEGVSLQPSHLVGCTTDGGSLFVRQVAESGSVPLRFDHEIAPICGWAVERMDVADVDQVVLVEDPTLCPVSLSVLLADEAIHAVILASATSRGATDRRRFGFIGARAFRRRATDVVGTVRSREVLCGRDQHG